MVKYFKALLPILRPKDGIPLVKVWSLNVYALIVSLPKIPPTPRTLQGPARQLIGEFCLFPLYSFFIDYFFSTYPTPMRYRAL
jgi:hypothetical protein